MSYKPGKDFMIKVNGNNVVGMGSVTIPGVDTDMMESTSFGNEWKTFVPGLKDGGEIAFDGVYDPADSTGQTVLRSANENNTDITDLKIYVDDNSYWIPATTNPLSWVNVTSHEIGANVSDLSTASFSLKVSGRLVFV